MTTLERWNGSNIGARFARLTDRGRFTRPQVKKKKFLTFKKGLERNTRRHVGKFQRSNTRRVAA